MFLNNAYRLRLILAQIDKRLYYDHMNAVDFVQEITTKLSGSGTACHVKPDDQGFVIDIIASKGIASIIGKQGRTIDAIRTIANALGQDGSHRLRVRLNEVEPAD